jgi:hypothetical protein
MWLYRKLSTQFKVFTWGNNQYGALGNSQRGVTSNQYVPEEMTEARGKGIIVDLQCRLVLADALLIGGSDPLY